MTVDTAVKSVLLAQEIDTQKAMRTGVCCTSDPVANFLRPWRSQDLNCLNHLELTEIYAGSLMDDDTLRCLLGVMWSTGRWDSVMRPAAVCG